MKKLLCASTASSALLLASAVLAPAVAADLSVAPMYKAPPPPLPPGPVPISGSPAAAPGAAPLCATMRHRRRPDAPFRSRRRYHRHYLGIQHPERQSGARLRGRYLGHQQKGQRVRISAQRRLQQRGEGELAFDLPRPLGYAQGNWLLYATAGGALANVENSIFAPAGTVSDQHAHWGWTAGGGVEVKLNQDWSAKVEYLYVGLQDKSYFNPAPNLVVPSGQRLRLDDHIVRVGVNYKLPWNVLDTFFKRTEFETRPRPERGPTAFPSRARACRCRRRSAGRPPAATAASGRCGCRRSSARRRPGSPRT